LVERLAPEPVSETSRTFRLFRGFVTNLIPTGKSAEQRLLPRLRLRADWRDLR